MIRTHGEAFGSSLRSQGGDQHKFVAAVPAAVHSCTTWHTKTAAADGRLRPDHTAQEFRNALHVAVIGQIRTNDQSRPRSFIDAQGINPCWTELPRQRKVNLSEKHILIIVHCRCQLFTTTLPLAHIIIVARQQGN
jgi:hypothetical protein